MNHPRTCGQLAALLAFVVAIGMSVLALATPAGAAPKAASKDSPPTRNGCAAVDTPSMARCFSLIRTDIKPKAATPQVTPAGYGPADLQSAYQLPSADAGGGRPSPSSTRSTTRRPRPTSGSTGRSTDCPPARPPTAASRRSTSAADRQLRHLRRRGLGAGDLPRPRHGVAPSARTARSCWSRPTTTTRTTSARRSNRRSPWAPSTSPTATAARARTPSESRTSTTRSTTTPASPSRPAPATTGTARATPPRRRASPPSAAPRCTRTPPPPRLDRSRPGTARAAAARPSSPSRRSRQDPAARTGRSPTCRRWPTRPPASRSTTRTRARGWQVYGGTSASAPIIASVYALAGDPGGRLEPNSFPYEKTRRPQRRDSGSNGSCGPAVPVHGRRRLRRPDRPRHARTASAAFRSGPHGTLTGTVTDGRHRRRRSPAQGHRGHSVSARRTPGPYTPQRPAPAPTT